MDYEEHIKKIKTQLYNIHTKYNQTVKDYSLNGEEDFNIFLEMFKDKDADEPDYKKACFLFMEYWESLPDEEKPFINKELKKYGL